MVTVAGGTRRDTRVALLHLGNRAASVPSSMVKGLARALSYKR